jgi:hypothetical protein
MQSTVAMLVAMRPPQERHGDAEWAAPMSSVQEAAPSLTLPIPSRWRLSNDSREALAFIPSSLDINATVKRCEAWTRGVRMF